MSKSVRPVQRHLVSLDPCPYDGGLRYLLTRERKKSFDVMVKCIRRTHPKDTYCNQGFPIHHRGKDIQSYRTVASIKKSDLNPHEKQQSGNRESFKGGCPDPAEHETLSRLLAIITKTSKNLKA